MGKSTREGFEHLLCRNRCQHSSTLHRTAIGGENICMHYNEIFVFTWRWRSLFAEFSEVEISCFKSKLLEILENLKSDVVSQDVLLDWRLTIDFPGLRSWSQVGFKAIVKSNPFSSVHLVLQGKQYIFYIYTHAPALQTDWKSTLRKKNNLCCRTPKSMILSKEQ